MNKENIDKDYLLRLLKNGDITSSMREIKINKIFSSEILVMDRWSSFFYDDLRPKEREIRKSLYEKYRFDSSSVSFIQDSDFKELTSLSEALISLVNYPQWLDIHLVFKKLSIPIDEDESGKFQPLVNKCIKAIISHFDKL